MAPSNRQREQDRERDPQPRSVAQVADRRYPRRRRARSRAASSRLDQRQVLAARLTIAARLGDEILPASLQRERCRMMADRRKLALEGGKVIHTRRAPLRKARAAHEDHAPLDRQLRDQRLHRLDVAVVPGELAQTCSAECRGTQA